MNVSPVSPIYRKYYININISRLPFHSRRRAEAVLMHAGRLSKAFSRACPSTAKK